MILSKMLIKEDDMIQNLILSKKSDIITDEDKSENIKTDESKKEEWFLVWGLKSFKNLH